MEARVSSVSLSYLALSENLMLSLILLHVSDLHETDVQSQLLSAYTSLTSCHPLGFTKESGPCKQEGVGVKRWQQPMPPLFTLAGCQALRCWTAQLHWHAAPPRPCTLNNAWAQRSEGCRSASYKYYAKAELPAFSGAGHSS